MDRDTLKNWVVTVTVAYPFKEKDNKRVFLNGFTQEQAARQADVFAACVGSNEGCVVGVSLVENHGKGNNVDVYA